MLETASFGVRAVVASALVHGTIAGVFVTRAVTTGRVDAPLVIIEVEPEPDPPRPVPPDPPLVLPPAAPTLSAPPRQDAVSRPRPASDRILAQAVEPTAAATPAVLAAPSTPLPSFTIAIPLTSSGTGNGGAVSRDEGTATRDADVVEISGDSALADRLYGPTPSYSREAQEARVEADLPLLILVDTAGHVSDAKVQRRAGYGLDEAALKAVRQWTFRPRLKDGHPVAVRVRWTMQFRLE